MTFNRALIISIFWHLFCFFAVTIIIVPVGIKQQGLSVVSFIGSILDEDSFRREFRDWRIRSDIDHPEFNRFLFPFSEKSGSQRLVTYADPDYLSRARPYQASIDEILEVEKRLPPELKKGPPPQPAERDFEVEGEARERAVLFKPPSPGYQGLVSTSQKEIISRHHQVRLKVIIAPDGRVKAVEKLASCGYPEIDLLAIRYIKKWSFAPLNPDKPQTDQEGILLLKFKAE